MGSGVGVGAGGGVGVRLQVAIPVDDVVVSRGLEVNELELSCCVFPGHFRFKNSAPRHSA